MSSGPDCRDIDGLAKDEHVRRLETESASLRAAVASAEDALRRANARAADLEGLLMETESETVVLKARADSADEAAENCRHELERVQEQSEATLFESELKLRAESAKVEELSAQLQMQINSSSPSNSAAGSERSRADPSRNDAKSQLRALTVELSDSQEKLKVSKDARELVLSQKMAALVELQCSEEKLRSTTDNLSKAMLELSSVRKEVLAKEKAMDELKHEVCELHSERNRAIVAVSALAEELKRYRSNILDISKERHEIALELDALASQSRSAIESVHSDAEDELAELRSQLCEFSAKHEQALEQKHGEVETIRKELNSKISSAENARNALIESHKKEISCLESTLEGRENELDVIRAKFAEACAEKCRLKTSLKDCNDTLAGTESTRSLLESRVQELQASIREMRGRLSESGDLMQRAAEEGRVMSEKMEAAISEADSCRRFAETRYHSSQEHQDKIFKLVKSVHKRLFEASGENVFNTPENLEEAVEQVRSTSAGLVFKLQSYKIAQEKIETLSSEIVAVSRDRDNFKETCEKLRENLRYSHDQAKETLHSLKMAHSTEKESIDSTCREQQSRIAELESRLSEQDHAAELTVCNLQMTQQDLERQLHQEQGVANDLRVKLEEKARTLTRATDEKENMEHKTRELERELNDAREQRKIQASESRDMQNSLQQQIEQMKAARILQEATSNQLVEDAAAEIERLKNADVELRATSEKHAKQLESLAVKCSSVAAEKNSLLHSLSLSEERACDLESQLRSISCESNSSKERALQAEDRATKLAQELDNLRTKLEREAMHEEESQRMKEAEICSIRNRLSSVEAEKRQLHLTLCETKEACARNREALEESQNVIAIKMQNSADLQDKLEEARCSIAELEARAVSSNEALKTAEENASMLSKRHVAAVAELEDEKLEVEKQHAEKVRLLTEEHLRVVEDMNTKCDQEKSAMAEGFVEAKAAWNLELSEIKQRGEVELLQAVEKISQQREAEEEMRANLTRYSSQLENSERTTDKLRQERDAVQAELVKARVECGDLRQQAKTVHAQLQETCNSKTNLDSKLLILEQAVTKLQVDSTKAKVEYEDLSRKHNAACEDFEKRLATLKSELENSQQETSAALDERNCAQSRLEFIEGHTMKSLEQLANDRQDAIVALEKELDSKSTTIKNLSSIVDELKVTHISVNALREKLAIAESVIAEKDCAYGSLQQEKQASQRYADDLEAKMSKLQESYRSDALSIEADLREKDHAISQMSAKVASATISSEKDMQNMAKLSDRCAELEQQLKESGSIKAQELFEALDKYDAVLQKCNQLRKRSKRFETLLALEKQKFVKLQASVKPSRNLEVAHSEDPDLKRQVSPSSKGLSPSMKRMRESGVQASKSSLASESRPPLAPLNH